MDGDSPKNLGNLQSNTNRVKRHQGVPDNVKLWSLMNTHLPPIRRAGIFKLALLGAAVATFCDLIHVQTGTLSYASPNVFAQAWWCFPGFAVAFFCMIIVVRGLDHFLPIKVERSCSTTPGSSQNFVESMLLFFFIYVLSGFAGGFPIFLSWVFYLAWCLRLVFTPDRAFMAILGLILALGGTVGESLLSAAGFVTYMRPDFLLVPAWLPGLYLHGAFALRDGYRLYVATAADKPRMVYKQAP